MRHIGPWILLVTLILAGAPATADNPATCLGDPWSIDSDGDGHFDECDNCVSIPNTNQANADGDNRGGLELAWSKLVKLWGMSSRVALPSSQAIDCRSEDMRFLLITDPGIEDIAADEVAERLPVARVRVAPYGEPGQVRVETDALEPLSTLATIHHIVEIRDESEARTLDDVRRAIGAIEFPELVEGVTFRATTECSGDSGVSPREMQGAAGAVIQRRYGNRVDLEAFDVNVRVDVYGGAHLVAGVQRTRKSLGKRIRRAKALRTSIQPTTAAAMLRLAGAHRGPGRLIDPLCGSGTIPVEAKRMNPQLDVDACDWDRATAEVARGTAANHGLAIDVRVCDARSLRKAYADAFDYIVTDPPYGVRLGKRRGVAGMYRALLPSWEEALAVDGRIVVAVVKLRTFRGALEGSDLRAIDERVVGAGGLRLRLVVLERS